MNRLFFLLLLLVTGCISEPPHSPMSLAADQVILATEKKFEKKYQMITVGEGAANNGKGKYTELTIDFIAYKILPLEGNRELMLNCIEDFLFEINHNEGIRPYLEHYPFTFKDVNICVVFYCQDNDTPYHPNYSCMAFWGGILRYYTTHRSEERYKPETKYEETYEEALKLSSTP